MARNPVFERADWVSESLCKTPEARTLKWFTEEGEITHIHDVVTDEWDEQRSICERCPVRWKCLDDSERVDAIFRDNRGLGFHFRAGMTPIERAEYFANRAALKISA